MTIPMTRLPAVLTAEQRELLHERGYSNDDILELQAGKRPEKRSATPDAGKRFATLGDDPSDDDVQRFVDFLKR